MICPISQFHFKDRQISGNSKVRSRKSEVGAQKSEVALLYDSHRIRLMKCKHLYFVASI